MDVDNTAERKPITFFKRGDIADLRLRVFDDEYHVHSSKLKECSQYFFKFLDSPDKQHRTSPTATFRYEWVTRVDDDGTWSLECADSENVSPARL
jgi:hypothetical protein